MCFGSSAIKKEGEFCMGLLSAFGALNALRKLQSGKSAKLSLAQIANVLINLQDAKKNLLPQQFNRVYDLFVAFQGAKTKIELHSMGNYYSYAIDIIRKFDEIAPYELYSGGDQLEVSLLMTELRRATEFPDAIRVNEDDVYEIFNQAASRLQLFIIPLEGPDTSDEDTTLHYMTALGWVLSCIDNVVSSKMRDIIIVRYSAAACSLLNMPPVECVRRLKIISDMVKDSINT